MEPCPVCGGQDVDPAGFCTTCGTFRATPADPAPAPPKSGRSPFLVPLIALSGTLVVLVAAIVIVLQLRQDSPCLVGTWTVTSHRENVTIQGVGDVEFTGQGARVELRRDGTGRTVYGTTYLGIANGRRIELTVTGSVTFHYAADGKIMKFSELESDGEGIVTVDGVEKLRQLFRGGADPARYTCEGDRLTQSTNRYEVVLTRDR